MLMIFRMSEDEGHLHLQMQFPTCFVVNEQVFSSFLSSLSLDELSSYSQESNRHNEK